MAAVCIKCSNKHPDYRTERTHLAMDPQTGATIAEAHYVEPEADRDLAVLYRAYANTARRSSFLSMVGRQVLFPADPRTVRENLTGRTDRFVPRARYFTPTWTEAARRAYYGLPA